MTRARTPTLPAALAPTAVEPFFAGSAYSRRDAEAGRKVREWIRANPAEAVAMANRHAAEFDRKHGLAAGSVPAVAKARVKRVP